MSGFSRAERVAQQVQAALADILLAGVRDPRVTPITITSVRLSKDLRVANVRFLPLGGRGDAREITAGLEAARGYLRREMGRRMRLKYVPSLSFHIDEGLDEALHVQSLIEQVKGLRGEE